MARESSTPPGSTSTGSTPSGSTAATPTSFGSTGSDRRGSALIVLCFVHLMLVLDDTVVNVALPTIRADLGFDTAGLAWVVNAYFLAFGGLLLVGGRAADLFGRRRVFLFGVALFGAASLLCGISQEPWLLIAGRFLQGTGAAVASPAALSLITLLFPAPGERAKAIGIWGGVGAFGGTSGLVLSGVLTDLASWRWVFFVNVPFAIAALVFTPRLVGTSRAVHAPRLDLPGALLGTGALSAVSFGLLQTTKQGWDSTTIGLVLLGVVLAVLFLILEARTAEPLVPLSFLAVRPRAVAVGTSLLFTAALFAMSFLLMLRLQTALDYDPLRAGLSFVPYGIAILLAVQVAAKLVTRLGVRGTLVTAFSTAALGVWLLSGVSPGDGYVTGVLPGLLIAGLGCGVGMPVLATAAVAGTTDADAGLGSAVLSSVQQLGGAVGISVLVTSAVRHDDAISTAGFEFASTLAAGLLVVGAGLVAYLLRHRSTSTEPVTPRSR